VEAPTQASDASRLVQLAVGPVVLEGILDIPPGARGLVLFVHGSGSSRHSPRNQFVAEQLHAGDLATLLLDLVVNGEEAVDSETAELLFDVDLLGQRVVAAIDWLAQEPTTCDLPLGCFGASSGTAAALVAAAERPERIGALVSRGGRPDLAGLALSRVKAPTLLIVGGSDYPVISMNRDALQVMSCERSLEVVPGATHLFEETGALESVARLTNDWFARYLLGEGRAT
jgi:pimeloyl-ACP methyl ester carboxylesterase